MKIKTGGGGIDKDGKPYRLPEVEREVPDDYFEKLAKAMSDAPRCDFIAVHPSVWKILTKPSKRRRS